jgi:hypothetical protein
MLAITIQPGDTMSGIAAAHNVSLSALEAANPQVTDPDLIYAGTRLNVPGGSYSSWTPSRPEAASPAPVKAAAVSGPSSIVPAWATCITFRESSNNPRAVNSIPGYIGNGGGLFGDLTSTWNNYDGYAQPFDAPVSVQIQFNDALSNNGANLQPWAADGCPGT